MVWDSLQGRHRLLTEPDLVGLKKNKPLIGYSPQVRVVSLASLRPFNVLLSGYPCGLMALSDLPYYLICKHM